MVLGLVFSLFTLSYLGVVHLQQTVSPQTFWPSAVPLAVRSPYFSSWLPIAPTSALTNTWPNFWNDDIYHLGWVGHVRIDGTTYKWLGSSPLANTTNLTAKEITPTRTILTVQAGPMDLTITFLTPIEPSDWIRQSIPFSYLAFEATSSDGRPHDVQVYSDISAEWLSGNRTALVNWTSIVTNNDVYHQIQLQSPSPSMEISNQAEDGTAYYAMTYVPGITYQTGQDQVVRAQFQSFGSLMNLQDTNFRGINVDYPVFGISLDLGNIIATESPVVWSVGYVRDPAIQYMSSMGDSQFRSPYFVTQYENVQAVIEDFLSDFNGSLARSVALDEKILQDASSISGDYGDLVSLAARQVFGGIDITVSVGADGDWNTSDLKIFMKDVGTSRRVSPVEVLYASFPMFLYINASYGKPLLSPLLEYQDTPLYGLPYAARDLGPNSQSMGYPIVSGDPASHNQGVERKFPKRLIIYAALTDTLESGNMLIMALAHARTSGDGSLISEHYNLFQGWANYLVNNSLTPTNQMSADALSAANMTNLAIKGIIGIQAMSEIARAVGQSDDCQHYASVASAYMEKRQSLALSSDQEHLLLSYGEANSWALMYNLFADRLLRMNLVSETIYDHQEAFYQSLFASAARFGLPIDSNAGEQANSAWLAFTAATMSNSTTRDGLLAMIWAHASFNDTTGVFPTMYLIDTGGGNGGMASPAQGAVFAPLALNVANTTITVPEAKPTVVSPHPAHSAHPTHRGAGAIAGGVVGGIAAAALLLIATFLWEHGSRPEQPSYEATPFELPPSSPADRRRIGIVPSKRQDMVERGGPESTGSSAAHATISAPVSSRNRNPPTEVSGRTLPTGDLVDLREEMQNLRRVIRDLHADNPPVAAPPSYYTA
ncbi:hypothetical protein AcV5_006948 [Taiwanofungus camphoratus]|nr:hypothetical protein AcV5_006948 [Antrodia cinnamomea]